MSLRPLLIEWDKDARIGALFIGPEKSMRS